MILAKTASFTPDALFAVISASVSLKVLALRVHAGPMSFKIFATPTDESPPSDGVTLSTMPEASAPNESDPVVFFFIFSFNVSRFFVNCEFRRIPTVSDVSILFSL